MRNFNIVIMFSLLLTVGYAQKSDKNYEQKANNAKQYENFGAVFTPIESLSAADMAQKLEVLAPNDSISGKFKAIVTKVCQAKGCWMTLVLADSVEIMVRFKDYDFFVPKDIVGKTVIVDGSAYVGTLAVEDQKHFAKDAGASNTEIDGIKTPKQTYEFIADGVLIKE